MLRRAAFLLGDNLGRCLALGTHFAEIASCGLVCGQMESGAPAGARGVLASCAIRRLATDTRQVVGHDASSLLKHISVQHLRVHLDSEASKRQTMTVKEVAQLILDHGIEKNEADAVQLVDALHVAGVVLRYKHQVYLNPDEVAELIIRALPDTAAEAEAHLREIEEQLQPLEAQLKRIDDAARWRCSAAAYGGLLALTAQTMLFARLTYWELSWDVMEPVAYFTGQGAVLAMYVYFLWTRRDFTYEGHFSKMTSTSRQKLIARTKFDAELYEKLHRDHARWQRYLRALPNGVLSKGQQAS